MDGADQLLLSERSHLLSLKQFLEAHLSKVQAQLQELSKERARLYAAIQERSRVTDLLCQSMMSGAGSLATPRQRQGATRPNSGSRTGRSQITLPHYGSRTQTSSSRSHVSLSSRHTKSFSAPVPLNFHPRGSSEEGGGSSRRTTPPKSARASNDGDPPPETPLLTGVYVYMYVFMPVHYTCITCL